MFEQICYFLRATSEWERIYKGFPLCSKFLRHLVTGYLSLLNLQKRAMRQTTWKSERSEPLELACFGTSIINKSTWKFKHSSSPPWCNHDVLLTDGKILGRPIRRPEYDDIKVTLQTWKKNGELKMTSKHWLDVLPVWAYLPLVRVKGHQNLVNKAVTSFPSRVQTPSASRLSTLLTHHATQMLHLLW